MADSQKTSPVEGVMGAEEIRRSYEALLRSLAALGPKLMERRTAAELQELCLRLGYFALALNHQMDGNIGKAEIALARADGRAAKMPAFFTNRDASAENSWSDTYH